MNYAPIIKEIGRGAKGARSLDRAQAALAFTGMLDGTAPELELGAILIALRIKSESLDELLGFKRAMDELGARISARSNSSPHSTSIPPSMRMGLPRNWLRSGLHVSLCLPYCPASTVCWRCACAWGCAAAPTPWPNCSTPVPGAACGWWR